LERPRPDLDAWREDTGNPGTGNGGPANVTLVNGAGSAPTTRAGLARAGDRKWPNRGKAPTTSRVVAEERSDTGNTLDEQQKAMDTSGRLLANAIYNAFRITTQLPTIRIGAGLHAALRWDRKRKYKANDLFDFRHAEAALPYCDYFLTERSLRHLLQDRNLRFGDLFPCKVYSEAAEVLDALSIG
jgi:hypothetical protein